MTRIHYLPAPRWIGIVLVLAVLLLATLRSAVGTRLDSFTVDEPWHVVAGTAYVPGEGFHLNPEHPLLVKVWVGAWIAETFRLPPAPDLPQTKVPVEPSIISQLKAQIAAIEAAPKDATVAPMRNPWLE